MDGPAGVTQCPIPPGEMFTYDFVVSLIQPHDMRRTYRFLGSTARDLLVSFPS